MRHKKYNETQNHHFSNPKPRLSSYEAMSTLCAGVEKQTPILSRVPDDEIESII